MKTEPVPAFKLDLSNHAEKRLRQRGITRAQLRCVIDFGAVFHAGDGCTAHVFGHRALKRMRGGALHVPPPVGIAAIVSNGGRIVTVEHIRRIPRHWRPAT